MRKVWRGAGPEANSYTYSKSRWVSALPHRTRSRCPGTVVVKGRLPDASGEDGAADDLEEEEGELHGGRR